MDFGGQYLFSASRFAVWEALNSTEILQQAIPGCTRIDWTSDHQLEAEIVVNLNVMKPKFIGDLTLSEVREAETYTLTGHGRGGLLGKVQAQANISLKDADDPSRSILTFSANGGASKTLMKLGKPLIGASAQHIIDRFFERFGNAMSVDVTPIAQQPGG